MYRIIGVSNWVTQYIFAWVTQIYCNSGTWGTLLGNVAGTSWYSPRYFAAGHLTSLIDAKFLIYILLLTIFSLRVTRVTLVPCQNTTQLAKWRIRRSPSEATRCHPACAWLEAQRWRLFRRQHAAAVQLETTPRPAAARPAALNRLKSTKQCAIPLLTPFACFRQELATPAPSTPSRNKLLPRAPRRPRPPRNPRPSWRCTRRKPALQLSQPAAQPCASIARHPLSRALTLRAWAHALNM